MQTGRRAAGRSGYHWDQATIVQRQRARLQRLESENYTSIPELDSELAADSARHGKAATQSLRAKRKKSRHLMQRRTLADILTMEMDQAAGQGSQDTLFYLSCTAVALTPPRHFCSVCGYRGLYTCVDCGMRFCSLPCKATHADTRCLKFVS
ncbi:Zinc finger HIT domain-containing protein 1 [Coemansia biformis]|uniref:Zinc finger HIT domain-containing protein 1 n=1 Tax=Coemansia biformis TaxID=1286918 RepID=A0A9W8CY24_9FUNG|nr:Zinc finger HIT domain-containing protein 1 [Coemansia biformis]